MILLLFVVFAIRTSWFQTWLAQQASAYLSKEIGTEISIDKVEIDFFDALNFEGVYAEDSHNDTLLFVESLCAQIEDWSLEKEYIKVSELGLLGGQLNMRRYKEDSTLNFQHIIDYFASDEPDSSASNFEIEVKQINLEGVNFVYDDEHSEPLENGLDYAHIKLNGLEGSFSDFSFENNEVGVQIADLRFIEQSGLQLMHLTTKFQYSPEKLDLSKLKIGLFHSYLSAEYFQLHTPNGAEDWSDFLNKVKFNTKISNSKIHTTDLALFIPELTGLRSLINLNSVDASGPVYGMKLKHVDMNMLDTTAIRGDFEIPDLTDIHSAFFTENLTLFRTSIADMRKLNWDALLDDRQDSLLEINLKQFEKADVIALENGSFIGGLESFVVDGDLSSGIGNIHSETGIQFNYDQMDQTYHYKGTENESFKKHIVIEELDLATITNTNVLGPTTGYLRIDGKGFDEENIDISLDGQFSKIQVFDYDYRGITIHTGSRFHQLIFDGEIDVEDDNLALKYDGFVDLNNDMNFNFDVKLDSARLDEIAKRDSVLYQKLASNIHVNIYGVSINDFYGDIRISNLNYSDDSVHLNMDEMTIHVARGEKADTLILRSPYVDADLSGKYDLNDVGHAITEQLSYVLDHIVAMPEKRGKKNEFFTGDVRLKDVNSLIQFYDPAIYVQPNTHIRSEFNHQEKRYAFDINSSLIKYHGTEWHDVNIEHHFDSLKANVFYEANYVQLTDSLSVNHFYFDSEVRDNKLSTMSGWDGVQKIEPALFAFETEITKSFDFLTNFSHSFFFLKGHKYEISPTSRLLYNPDNIVFEDFKISNKGHYVKLNGAISQNPNDWLNIQVHDFLLSDLNGILGDDLKLKGILNVQGQLADFYGKPKFQTMSEVEGLELDGILIGDVLVNAKWLNEKRSVSLRGRLKRDNEQKFKFQGLYLTDRSRDNIKLSATFDSTDISFLNAFSDPDLYTDIQGQLDGELKIRGELDNPIITGDIDVIQAKVKVPMFNVYFGASGLVELEDGEILAEHLTVMDQESNLADCHLQIYHYDWEGWNYNISLDMDNPNVTKKFLAMDTYYQEGDYYHGKAYVTGFVDISGYGDQTEIEVDVKTMKGTDLTLPMYGSSDLTENSFVVFDEKYFLPDSLKGESINMSMSNVERLGLILNMKFHVTPDAVVKIVFDPLTEDQIVSEGRADLDIRMDDFGDLTMRGKYAIKRGTYQMRIKKLVEEDFTLVEGGTVEWIGSPYDALIDLKARFSRNVSLADIMPPEAGSSKKKDVVYGELLMQKTLMSPELNFKITSPTANDLGQKALAELDANKDELNKQFFALLVLKSFIPIYGGTAGGENVILGIAESQINSILSGVSENYDFKAGLSDGQTTLGFQTQINERTTISTSFGVLNPEDGVSIGSAGNLVGDVDIEYRLNEDGTFTMNFFNETNEASITAQGHFTQGVSLHYQETFNSSKEFRLLQKFLNIFRKKDKRVKFEKENRRSEKWQPLPPEE